MCRDPWPRAGCGSSWRCRSPLDAGCHVPWSGPPSTLTVGVGSVLPSSGFFMLFQILLKCLLMQIFKFALSRVAGSLYWSSGLHSVL